MLNFVRDINAVALQDFYLLLLFLDTSRGMKNASAGFSIQSIIYVQAVDDVTHSMAYMIKN